MKLKNQNDYEKAFESWLRDNSIKYTAIDQARRAQLGKIKVKSFDYLLYPENESKIICEVKGRIFKGTSFENLKNLQCWVLAADIEGLQKWRQLLGEDCRAFIIFVYKPENIDVDFDGRDHIEVDGDSYTFLAVELESYRNQMTLRSPKWRTVTLAAEKFRNSVVGLEQMLLYH
jgi:hypothetical protein